MMLRNFIALVAVVASVVAVALIVAQRRELASLHEQKYQLQQQATETPQPVPQPTGSAVSAPNQQHSPSVELLRLRGEIGQLERRKRELAGVRAENEKLQVQLTTKGTNTPGGIPLPGGYLRTTEAKFMGYDTPEDTIQTMLWAIRSRDTNHFLQVFNSEMAKQLEAEMQRRGSPEEFFKEADAMPGLRIVGKETGTDETVMLNVEMLPGDETNSQKMRFKQFGGEWKLMSGL